MFEKCQGQSVKVCPADEAVTDTKAKSCALSLFLEKQAAHLRCRNMGAWTTTHLVLQEPGILEGAQSCQISLGNLQLYAEVRGSSQFDAPSEPLIITPQLPVTSDGELQALRKVMDTHSIDQLIDKVNTHKMEADLADLIKLDPHSTTNTVTNTHWTTPLLLATSVIVTLVILYYCTCTHGKVLLRCCIKKESRSPTLEPVQADPTPQVLPSSTPPVSKDAPSTSDNRPNFAMYAVHNN